jgi:hypothetical protein
MILQRLLAGNVFKERQKRFKNMYLPNPLDLKAQYRYRLEILFTYKSAEAASKDVVDFSWCPGNTDLLAIAYGVYNYKDSKYRNIGYVCVWSIKVSSFFFLVDLSYFNLSFLRRIQLLRRGAIATMCP